MSRWAGGHLHTAGWGRVETQLTCDECVSKRYALCLIIDVINFLLGIFTSVAPRSTSHLITASLEFALHVRGWRYLPWLFNGLEPQVGGGCECGV